MLKELLSRTHRTVVSNTCGLPATIVSTGVTLVQLEAVVFVPPHVEQGHAERTFACRIKQ